MPLTNIKPFICRAANSSSVVVKLQQIAVTSIKDTDCRNAEWFTACNTEFTVDNWGLMDGHLRMTGAQIIDVVSWAICCEEYESSIPSGTRIKRLTLSKQ
tara:strand:+ start:743 stop:1042 length:300 start_codon:yes stop_codon:yes gene_type:complete